MSLRPSSTGTSLRVATGVLALTILSAGPAAAATAPDWPASRTPTGADCVVAPSTPSATSGGALREYDVTDSQQPVVTGWTVNGQSALLTLGPGPTLATFRVSATQTCGGVGSLTAGLVVGSAQVSQGFPFLRDSTDAFHSVWSVGVTLTPEDAGAYRIPTVDVAPRYASFVLSPSGSLVRATGFTGSPTTVSGPWSTRVVYVVRATTQSPSASRAVVAAGRKVTFRTILRRADVSGYLPAPGSVVVFQTRLPRGRWTTRARLRTDASGRATVILAPTRTMLWRWVHPGTTSGDYTGPSVTAPRTIGVRG